MTAKTTARNKPGADHLASQPHAFDNSGVPNAPIKSLAEPPAKIPVVCTDHDSTVAALPTVQPVAFQRGGAQRYDMRFRVNLSKKDAFLVIVVLILLLSLAAGSSFMSPLFGIALNSKNSLNYWASMENVST